MARAWPPSRLRDAEGDHDAAEGGVLPGQVIGEVAASDDLHLHAQEGEEGPDPEKPVLPVFKRIEGAGEPTDRIFTLTSR